jgi:hypothetical protein
VLVTAEMTAVTPTNQSKNLLKVMSIHTARRSP